MSSSLGPRLSWDGLSPRIADSGGSVLGASNLESAWMRPKTCHQSKQYQYVYFFFLPSKKILIILKLRCFKGCGEWKTSAGGSLFEAKKPEGCDCEKVTVANVEETFSASSNRMESNRWGVSLGWGGWGLSFGNDKPQDMSAA